jgi:hypothetical protein
MNLFVLYTLAIPFLAVELTGKEDEKIRVNVPKTLVEESLAFAEFCDEKWEKDGETIPRDSLLEILKEAQIGDEPVLEITKGKEIIRFWVRDSKDIIDKAGTPKKLLINVKSDKEEDNVNLRVPLTFVKILPYLIPEIGEEAADARQIKLFLRKALKYIQKVEGGFTLIEVEDKHEKVKISVE